MITIDNFNEQKSFTIACCNFYEDKIVQTLLGSSFHPGGLELTKKIGEKLQFSSSDRILDLASGLGSSAIYIAETFGSYVNGIELSKINVEKARNLAQKKHVNQLVVFQEGDVSKLPFEDNSFDYILSECSFCLFENKNTVGEEIKRVLKPNGRVVITDIAIEKQLPFELNNLLYKVACIASALSMSEYTSYFEKNGFKIQSVTGHKEILLQLAEDVKKKVFVLELASGLKKINLKKDDLKEIKSLIKQAKDLINDGYATYMILIGENNSNL